jgi:hypothetical protein
MGPGTVLSHSDSLPPGTDTAPAFRHAGAAILR